MKIPLGIVITTFALYIWGFIFWGLSPITYSSWKQTANDAATQQMMQEAFPEPGTYYLPGFDHKPEERARLFEQGPVGFVHINEGRPEMDSAILLGGLILNLVIVALMAGLFRMVGATEFRDFARLSVGAGAVAVVMIHGGEIIWWQVSASWKIWPLLYDFTAWLLVGHLLGVFMKAPAAD